MNTEVQPYKESGKLLKQILGSHDLDMVSQNTGISKDRLQAALDGRVGLETAEINLLTSGIRASSLATVTANERKAASAPKA